jgi:hypothetical protein
MSVATRESHIVGRLDVDQVGDKLELYLLRDDIDGARVLHELIQDSMEWLRRTLVEKAGCELLYCGCDDVLFRIEVERYRQDVMEEIREQFQNRTGCTLSLGFGSSIGDALRNLCEAKLSGRNRVVGPSRNELAR